MLVTPPVLREEEGFGLIEVVIALAIMTIAVTMLVASFSSAAVLTTRAAKISTAGVVADSQMERFRAMTYDWIGLDTTAATDAVYKADVACIGGSTCTNVTPSSLPAGAASCKSGGTVYGYYPMNCAPSQTVTGPDNRSYRLDTYVRAVQTVTVGNPRQTKIVVVVVRDPAKAGSPVLAREESDFDYCSALPDPSGTGAAC